MKCSSKSKWDVSAQLTRWRLSMNTQIGTIAPAFELKGRASKIDLSAWISGLSYTFGIVLVAHERINVTPDQSSAITFGLIACLAAFFIAVLAIQKYMRLSLLANTFGAPAQLVTSGIFKYSRNPIYVAFLIPLASLALLSISAAILAITLYVAAMNVTVLRKEERDLVATFGQTYTAYATRVPRWIF
jgi:protein-S-isoprenylcysteine O-methyltransferase Ste14